MLERVVRRFTVLALRPMSLWLALLLTVSGACSEGDASAANQDASASTGGATGASSTGVTGNASGGAASGGNTGLVVEFGEPYAGGEFHEGPVDWDETQWHNACAPITKYAAAVRQAEGELLAGLWNGIPNVAAYCDACIAVQTAKGKEALLRVVTYGDTTPNSIDVSPAAYQILNSNEYPRSMSFRFAKCGDTGKVMYEFQTGANEWWTSLWVRNARLPLKKIEVKSPNHASYVELVRGGDGTLTDGGGFGKGRFTIRLTGIDDQVIEDSFDWPVSGIAGQMLTGAGNFQ